MPIWGKPEMPDTSPSPTGSYPGSRGGTPALARVLVLSQAHARARELAKLLRSQGFAALPSDFSTPVQRLYQDDRPDLALIDAGDTPEKGCKLAAAFRNGNGLRIPVMMVAEWASPDIRQFCLSNGIDDLVTPPYSDTVVTARLRPLLRLATMEYELERRLATARGLGIDADDAGPEMPDNAMRRVLVVGDGTDDCSEVERALGADTELITAPDVFAAAAMLHERPFDALVGVIKGAGEDALYLCGQIRNNTRLFNLPVLLVADGGAFDSVDEPYLAGATAVVLRPIDESELKTGVESLVRRQKRLYGLRSRFAALQAKAGQGQVGGVYSSVFARAHLDRLACNARETRKQLSVVSFQIQNLGYVMRDFGHDAADDLLRQVAEWIGVLVRAEDFLGRLDEKEFCVALPDTAIEDAEVVAQRISGVILNTQFAAKGTELPLGAWLQSGAADYHPGDSAALLIERAHDNLK